MTTEEAVRNMEAMSKAGIAASEAFARMAEGFRQIKRASRTMREWLGLPRLGGPFPKQILIVTMDDGVTRRVVRW